MPDRGKLTVETANCSFDKRMAREPDLSPGQYVSLSFSDNGTGMTPDVAVRALDPFYATKPVATGAGLGLSMVYGFVRQSGGRVRIYSEPGRGTIMRLYLPRSLSDADALEAGPEGAETPHAKDGETVLVVDDEPALRMLITDVLEELGYIAIESDDAVGALRVVQSYARIDILITYIGLSGGMSGRQLADAARERRRGLKVLFITGYSENALLSHGHLGPDMHVMTKPLAMNALANRIRELIATG